MKEKGKEKEMQRPLRRHGVNKHRSARRFRANIRRTKSPNVRAPMRGGWRL